jgi:hypothetical protein
VFDRDNRTDTRVGLPMGPFERYWFILLDLDYWNARRLVHTCPRGTESELITAMSECRIAVVKCEIYQYFNGRRDQDSMSIDADK